jgi:25S rRNA (adenine2142-N1)-methyltransferase
MGGLERYQAMSSIGQSAVKGGGSEKVVIPWLKEIYPRRAMGTLGCLR